MSDNTFHVTSEDVRKIESEEAKFHGGQIPKDSDTAALKVSSTLSLFHHCVSEELLLTPSQQLLAEQENKQETIDRVKANLPLPDQPVGGASADLQSADGRTVNVGSGGVNVKLGTNSSDGLREPATAESSVRTDGEELKKNTAP